MDLTTAQAKFGPVNKLLVAVCCDKQDTIPEKPLFLLITPPGLQDQNHEDKTQCLGRRNRVVFGADTLRSFIRGLLIFCQSLICPPPPKMPLGCINRLYQSV